MTRRIDSKAVFTIFFIVLSVLLFRRYDAFVNPQLYAEDGAVFLQQFENSGISSLWQPYAGYLHTLLRLVAVLGGLLHIDLLYIPVYYNAAAFAIAFMLALYLYYCASLLDIKHKLLFATSFLFIPVNSEIFMNLTNSIWLAELGLVAFLFVHHGHISSGMSGLSYYGVLLMVLLLSFTGPCSLIISPVVVLVMFKGRKTLTVRQLIPLFIILLGAAVQAYCIKFSGTNVARTNTDIVPENFHFLKMFAYNIRDMFYLNSHYVTWTEQTKNIVAGIISIPLFAMLAYVYIKVKHPRKYILLLAGVLFFASFVISFWPNEVNVLAMRSARYYFIPLSCIAMLIIIAADNRLLPLHLAGYVAFFSLHVELIRFSLPNKNWEQEALFYKNSIKSKLSINPDGWFVELPPLPEPIAILDYNGVPEGFHFGDKEKEIAFWGNSSITTQPLTLSPGSYVVTVIIIGYPLDGVGTHHNIYVNDRKAGDFYATQEYDDYSVPFSIDTPATAVIKIDMDNDASNGHEDRNAFMKAMVVRRVQ
jgi:hypothetical protein